jgi:hypothetical protein
VFMYRDTKCCRLEDNNIRHDHENHAILGATKIKWLILITLFFQILAELMGRGLRGDS